MSGMGHGTLYGEPVNECDVRGSATYSYRGVYPATGADYTGSYALWLR